MKDHYNINSVEWARLEQEKITSLDLVQALPKFDINESQAEITKIHLMYYIDRHGDFTARKNKIEKIAFAVFNSLLPADKVEIIKYLPDDEE